MGIIRDLWNLGAPATPTEHDDWGEATSDAIDALGTAAVTNTEDYATSAPRRNSPVHGDGSP